jgi:hypothetical protein
VSRLPDTEGEGSKPAPVIQSHEIAAVDEKAAVPSSLAADRETAPAVQSGHEVTSPASETALGKQTPETDELWPTLQTQLMEPGTPFVGAGQTGPVPTLGLSPQTPGNTGPEPDANPGAQDRPAVPFPVLPVMRSPLASASEPSPQTPEPNQPDFSDRGASSDHEAPVLYSGESGPSSLPAPGEPVLHEAGLPAARQTGTPGLPTTSRSATFAHAELTNADQAGPSAVASRLGASAGPLPEVEEPDTAPTLGDGPAVQARLAFDQPADDVPEAAQPYVPVTAQEFAPAADVPEAAQPYVPVTAQAFAPAADVPEAPETSQPTKSAFFPSPVGAAPPVKSLGDSTHVDEPRGTHTESATPTSASPTFVPGRPDAGTARGSPRDVQRSQVPDRQTAEPGISAPPERNVQASPSTSNSLAPPSHLGPPELPLAGHPRALQRQTDRLDPDRPGSADERALPGSLPRQPDEHPTDLETASLVGRGMPELVVARTPWTASRADPMSPNLAGPPSVEAQVATQATAGPFAAESAPGSNDVPAWSPTGSRPAQHITSWGGVTAFGPLSPSRGTSAPVTPSSGATVQLMRDDTTPGHLPILSVPRPAQRAATAGETEAIVAQSSSIAAPVVPPTSQPPVSVSNTSGDPGSAGSTLTSVQRAAEPPGAEPPGAGSDSSNEPPHHEGKGGEDIDDLSRRIYDRIRDRLKAELYLDRERAGQLSDLTV